MMDVLGEQRTIARLEAGNLSYSSRSNRSGIYGCTCAFGRCTGVNILNFRKYDACALWFPSTDVEILD